MTRVWKWTACSNTMHALHKSWQNIKIVKSLEVKNSWIIMITLNYSIVPSFLWAPALCSGWSEWYSQDSIFHLQSCTLFSSLECVPYLQDTANSSLGTKVFISMKSRYSWNATQVLIVPAVFLWDKRMVCSLTTANQGRQVMGEASANFGCSAKPCSDF